MTQEVLEKANSITKELDNAKEELKKWTSLSGIRTYGHYNNQGYLTRLEPIPDVHKIVREMYMFYWSQRITTLESELKGI